MPKGSRKTPLLLNCQTCNQVIEHWGSTKHRKYCSDRCKYPNRYRDYIEKPLLTTEQIIERRRERSRQQYAEKREIVRQYKFNAKHCKDCQMEINERTIICIDLDHRDPATKTFTIAYKFSAVSKRALIEELNKCDAVCRNCHAYRTHDGKHWHNRYSQPNRNAR